ncbi:pyruvate dehydrogenase complex dihydrolipoamide acetyltransferase [Pontibacter sp. G13]|uniref:pyruvate dehydrogenase complex dihydrolipoamide acetyltransferase n=1 Tax=Pontibacter sp. G13 TaxID=3074898 RepID=UPI00288B6DA8|nr:pyruvate dehydrogenase complex dihydrolipoamide acetyltransferase [Pontibacter sp. G13]WNJ17220.1 pyruvate dehydrogenase complex dihydrolipoamide acetyltransferase [Pontibacter sp. G13]
MAEIIDMPRLSDTMTEGVIAAWHQKVGDTVSSGDLLAEIETDKATMDFESPADGKLLFIGVEEGKGIPVGALLAIVGEDGEDVDKLVADFKSASPAAEAAPEAEAPAVEAPVAPAPTPTPAPVAQPAATPQPVAAAAPVVADGRIKASPLAKAMAKDKGIDLATVAGSGDNGRIIKRDIENYQAPAAVAAPVNGAAPVVAAGAESYDEVTVSQMRKVIARRLGESKFSAPHFYLTMEINMGKAMVARKALNEVSPVKISFNDIVMKATAAALRQHPKINSSWLGDRIRTNHHIHIGMAVAVDEGLLVPVIRFADTKGLSTIAAETKDLAGKARDRKLQPADWEGNTFTISNLGMFGIEEFTAIINPPDACILAIGGIIQKPIVENGEIVPGNMMKVTLSCDHRVVDGAMGSAFLQTLKQLLEDPMRILL